MSGQRSVINMEGSSLGGWFLSRSGQLADMEMPVNKCQKGPMGQPLMTHQAPQFHPLNLMKGADKEQRVGLGEAKELTSGGMSMDLAMGKGISPGPSFSNNTTSEDEPSFTEDVHGENCNGSNSRREAQWQRMRWTDNVIKLLIAVVASVGDDSMYEASDGLKRKCGVLHRKGKWKMVSNIMIGKGCCVSPQQCEDKFNDLNKRYKKLNDILGRGTSCQVVENPSLMDSMPHLTPKAKGEVKKILTSKHLFYREMCAYHNGQMIPGCHDIDLQAHLSTSAAHSSGHDASEEHEAHTNDESNDDGDSSEEDEKNAEGNSGRVEGNYARSNVNEENTTFRPLPSRQDGSPVKLPAIFKEMTKSPAERRAWIRQQLCQLEDQKLRLQAEALDIEKQRFRWLRFRSKKDRELEGLRVENERMKLENDRKVLWLEQKRVLLGLPKAEASPDCTSTSIHGVRGKR